MKPIEAKENPFYCVMSILEACRERGAFQEEEMKLVDDVHTVMQLFGAMLENESVDNACSNECDCEKQLDECDSSCETESNIIQLELPLKHD
jgi:hypothetical protein